MRNLRFQVLLLVLALFLGQWISVVHASSHSTLAAEDVDCDACQFAPDIGGGGLQLPQLEVPTASHESPRALVVPVLHAAVPSFYAIRGPPRRLSP